MKKTFLAVFCVISFLLITGGVILEDRPHPVLINGKPFANAVMINGVLAISAEDLVKVFGADFRQQGTTLSTSPRDPASGLPTGKRMHKPFVITKQIDVSTAVIMKDGKSFVPFADVVTAFGGGVWKTAPLRSGQPINLNFAPNAKAAFAVGQ
jgi:hypothetical protein